MAGTRKGRFSISPLIPSATTDLQVTDPIQSENPFKPELPQVHLLDNPNESPKEGIREESVPITLLNMFRDTLSSKFSEMMSTHKDLIKEFLVREQTREERIRDMLKDISDATKENVALRLENQKLRDLLNSRFNL